MDLERIQIRITDHAYNRFCQRVGPIDRCNLEPLLRIHLMGGYRMTKGYLHTGGIWWRAKMEDDVLTLHTCYGETHIDIPNAVKWAKRFRDRIALG